VFASIGLRSAGVALTILSMAVPGVALAGTATPDRPGVRLTSVDRTGHPRWSTRVAGGDRRITVLGVRDGVVVAGLTSCDSEPDGPVPPPSLVAYDAKTGTVRWRAPDPGAWARQFGLHGTIVTQDDTSVTGLDPTNGDRRWRIPTGGGAIAVGGSRLLVRTPTKPGSIVAPGPLAATAYDLRTGRKEWHVSLPGAANGWALMDDTSVVGWQSFGPGPPIVTFNFVVLDPSSGVQRFGLDHELSGASVDVAGSRLVLWPDNGIVGLDSTTGAERWRLADAGVVRGFPTPASDVYAHLAITPPALPVTLVNVDTADGTVRWRVEGGPDELVAASTRLAVLVDRSSSTAVALDARTGERRWSVSLADITASAAIDRAANTYLASGCALSED
jgi:outer membrane protein assembly factor BamB